MELVTMQRTPCAHNDIRLFDNTLYCLSCGARRHLLSKHTTPPGGATVRDPELGPQPYEYTSLRRDQNDFRLVVLLAGARSDPICCRIITADLDAPPEYIAISYTWATEDGDASMSREIFVEVPSDRRTIRVTSNCEATLRQMRGVNSERTIWMDSLSINQMDVHERNQQVRLMDQIYQNAASVEICIQDPRQNYWDTMALLAPKSESRYYRLHGTARAGGTFSLRHIDRTALHTMSFQDREKYQFLEEREHYRLLEGSTRDSTKLELMQLAALFNRRYFGRVWVIQEVVLARVAVLHVNDDLLQLSSSALEEVQILCDRHSISVPRLSHWISAWKRNSGIVSCLNMSLNCSASDPRDQVFAIANLLEPHTRDMIMIDYMSDLQSVFVEALVACITECGDLDILGYTDELWEANFDKTCVFGMENFKTFLRQRNKNGIPHRSQIQMRSPWVPNIFIDRGHVKGAASPDITVTPRTHQATAVQVLPHAIPSPQLLPRLKVRAHLLDISTGSISHSASQLLTVLEAGVPSIAASPWHWLLSLFLSPFTSANPPHNASASETNDYDTTGLATLAADLQHIPLPHEQIVFRTHYTVGFTACHILPGDAIYALNGAHHFFVLREVRTGVYRIVGKCYLWAGMSLDYWKPGTYRGIWTSRPCDLGGEQSRVIEVY